MKRLSCVVLAMVLALCVAGSARAYEYFVTDLGTLGGTTSRAFGLNDNGQAAGYSRTSSNHDHAFIWDSTNGMTDLGTLGGTRSYGEGLNDNGQVTGWSKTGFDEDHAFIWDSINGMTDLGTLGGQEAAVRASTTTAR